MGVYPGDPAPSSRADTTLLPKRSILGLSRECSSTSDGPQLSNIRKMSQFCEASSAITPLNNALTLPPAMLRFCFTVADQTTYNGPQVLNIRNLSQLCGASSATTPLNNALTLSSCHTSTLFGTSEATFDPTAADPTCVPLAAATTDLTAAEATALSGA